MFLYAITANSLYSLFVTLIAFKKISSSIGFRRNSLCRFDNSIHYASHVFGVPKCDYSRVKDLSVCVLQCLENKQFLQQTLLLALTSMEIDFDLLPRDRYNTSDSFRPSQHFHHQSTKVRHVVLLVSQKYSRDFSIALSVTRYHISDMHQHKLLHRTFSMLYSSFILLVCHLQRTSQQRESSSYFIRTRLLKDFPGGVDRLTLTLESQKRETLEYVFLLWQK